MDTPDSTTTKRCTKCGEFKSHDQFARSSQISDGMYSYCKACASEYQRAYRQANIERLREMKREYQRVYHKNNVEKERTYRQLNSVRLCEYQRLYQQDYQRGYHSKYKQTERGKAVLRSANHARRARKARASGSFTAADLVAIRTAQTDKKGRLVCWKCGKPIKGTPHLDHWIPLDKEGTNYAGNLHYMHAKCNLSKGAKHPYELGRLI